MTTSKKNNPMNKLEIVTEIAKGYNNLNSSTFEVLASDDISYESQWVLNSIYGKAEIFNYLNQKFETIKNSETKLFAELAYFGEDPCIILAQDTKENKVATVLIDIANEQIGKMTICEVPNWRDAKKTNQYPK